MYQKISTNINLIISSKSNVTDKVNSYTTLSMAKQGRTSTQDYSLTSDESKVGTHKREILNHNLMDKIIFLITDMPNLTWHAPIFWE